jgi:hypothetical protein
VGIAPRVSVKKQPARHGMGKITDKQTSFNSASSQTRCRASYLLAAETIHQEMTMSVKNIALALALSLSVGSVALAQSDATNTTPATSGTIDAPRPGSTQMSPGSNTSSTANGSTEGTDNSVRASTGTMTHKTTHHKKHVSTAKTVKSMSNGSSGNAMTPNTQIHGTNGG